MSRYGDEKVLVVPRRVFDELGAFQGLAFDVERYVPKLLDPSSNFFLDRAAAEDDPSHKQIIPYALFHHNGRFLRYVRGSGSGEQRLASRASIGIGGHINQSDHDSASLGKNLYLTGVEREIREELIIGGPYRQRIVALINDDSNEVGSVHLGIVHIFDLENADIQANEPDIGEIVFLPPFSLRAEKDRLESWSQLCLEILDPFAH
ncbi:MAG TPA: hypothetical protein VMN36_08860 [Verrucomicrobiales bacterium]|nr:hypothetical protein [Verrucomicrobiales bacterium]